MKEFKRLGFLINEEKSVLLPQKRIQFLGFDLSQTAVSVTKEAAESFKNLVKAWEKDRTYRFLLQALGTASWCSIVGRLIPNITAEVNQLIPAKVRCDRRMHDTKCTEVVNKAAEAAFEKLSPMFEKGITLEPRLYDKTYLVYVDAAPHAYLGFVCGSAIN